jgi:hypothetical protein
MPVEAFIKTGDRSMGSYLTKPLFDQVAWAFRERWTQPFWVANVGPVAISGSQTSDWRPSFGDNSPIL